MKWLKDRLGRAFWWVVLVLAAIVTFIVVRFTRKTPKWFGTLLDNEIDKQDHRRSVKGAEKGLEKLEVEREKRIEKDAVRTESRVDRFRDRVRRRREEANAAKPDQD